MINRRTLLQTISAAAVLAPFASIKPTIAANKQGSFSFGVLTDPQYAAIASNGQTRFYANSLWKLEECINHYNKEELEFVITLGDIIDRHYTSFNDILPIYDRLKHPNFFVLGNHDYDVAGDYIRSISRTVGLTKNYYDFNGGGYRFIVIDGNEISLFAPPKGHKYLNIPDDPRLEIAQKRFDALKAKGADNAQIWNGSLSDEQFQWLENTIQAAEKANERVVVFGHYPIFPANMHNMWDSDRLLDLLTAHKNVIGYFCGHNHQGNYGEKGGKYFVNLKGMVETPDTTAYSIFTVHDDRLEIKGFGREENRTLKY